MPSSSENTGADLAVDETTVSESTLHLAAKDIIASALLQHINKNIHFLYKNSAVLFNKLEINEDNSVTLQYLDSDKNPQKLTTNTLEDDGDWAPIFLKLNKDGTQLSLSPKELDDCLQTGDHRFAIAVQKANTGVLTELPPNICNEALHHNLATLEEVVKLVLGKKGWFSSSYKFKPAMLRLHDIVMANGESKPGPWLSLETESADDKLSIVQTLADIFAALNIRTNSLPSKAPNKAADENQVNLNLEKLKLLFSTLDATSDTELRSSKSLKPLISLKKDGSIFRALLAIDAIEQVHKNNPAHAPQNQSQQNLQQGDTKQNDNDVEVMTDNRVYKDSNQLFSAAGVDFIKKVNGLRPEQMQGLTKTGNNNKLQFSQANGTPALEIERLQNNKQKITYHLFSDNVYELTVNQLKPKEIKTTKFIIEGGNWQDRLAVAQKYLSLGNGVELHLEPENAQGRQSYLSTQQLQEYLNKASPLIPNATS